ncbi:uncharacterized protein LOC125506623 [Triticum urartu]|uniref:uncharacterized protein LOC125506623 n=1 Tax=Triticum urartu TaxID=4572 RepID=UPI002043B29F|nr:uncharacterized protein LOC125506623 [Triticum urartu]
MDPTAPAFNRVAAPTVEDLDQRALLIRDKFSAEGWLCPRCYQVNNQIDNLLYRVPAFECTNPDKCNAKCPGTVELSITDCIMNTVRTNFLIRSQGDNRNCTAHAVLAGMDAALKIEGALRGVPVLQPLNGTSLLRDYHRFYPDGVGHEREREWRGYRRYEQLLRVAQAFGVEYVSPMRTITRALRLQSWFRLTTRQTSMDYLVRLIANGYPLLATMEIGRWFRMAADGHLYMGPPAEFPGNHAVLLIGSVARQVVLPNNITRQSEVVPSLLFKARNSNGSTAHRSAAQGGYGGDVYLLAQDLGPYLYGFRIEIPTWMLPNDAHGFGYRPRKTNTGRLPRFSPPHEKYLYRAKNTEFFE